MCKAFPLTDPSNTSKCALNFWQILLEFRPQKILRGGVPQLTGGLLRYRHPLSIKLYGVNAP